MTLICLNKGSVITPIETHYVCFKIPNFTMYKMLTTVQTGSMVRRRLLALSITVHEQSQLNRACNIFNFVVLHVLFFLLYLLPPKCITSHGLLVDCQKVIGFFQLHVITPVYS
jgi:hypothetical protein